MFGIKPIAFYILSLNLMSKMQIYIFMVTFTKNGRKCYRHDLTLAQLVLMLSHPYIKSINTYLRVL